MSARTQMTSYTFGALVMLISLRFWGHVRPDVMWSYTVSLLLSLGATLSIMWLWKRWKGEG
jgi:hypothetical protein